MLGITFRIEHTLGREDLIAALSSTQSHVDADEKLPSLSREAILREIRGVLAIGGNERFYSWVDDVDDKAVARIVAWATDCVDRTWPHLVPRAAS